MIDDIFKNEKEDPRLIRHIIKCYYCLSENQNTNPVLKKCIPQNLIQVIEKYGADEQIQKFYNLLKINLDKPAMQN